MLGIGFKVVGFVETFDVILFGARSGRPSKGSCVACFVCIDGILRDAS